MKYSYPTLTNVRERQASACPVKNYGRVERTLKLIVFLSRWRTIKECAEHLNVSKKTIHRYISMLIQLGFVIETNYGCHYVHKIKNIQNFFDLDETK